MQRRSVSSAIAGADISIFVLACATLAACASEPPPTLSFPVRGGEGSYSIEYSQQETPLAKQYSLRFEVFDDPALLNTQTLAISKMVFDREVTLDAELNKGTARYSFAFAISGTIIGVSKQGDPRAILTVTIDGRSFDLSPLGGRYSVGGGSNWLRAGYVIPAELLASLRNAKSMSVKFMDPIAVSERQLAKLRSFVADTEGISYQSMAGRADQPPSDPGRQAATMSYIASDGPGVFLKDGVFNVRVRILSSMPGLPGSYGLMLSYEVENTSANEARFDPHAFEIVGIDNGQRYQPSGKGRINQSFLLGAGKKTPAAVMVGFDVVQGQPPKQLKLSLGQASATVEGKSGAIRY